MTTMTEPTTRTLDAPGADAHLRRPGGRRAGPSPGPAPDRLADGRERVRHPGRPLHRSHGRDLRPARRRAQHEGRSGEPSRRPSSTPTTCIGSSTSSAVAAGRPLREQRRRGERARARREAPGAGPDARRARAPARGDPARPRGCAGGHRGDRRHLPAAAGSVPAWPSSSSPSATQGPIDAGFRRPSPRRIRRCSACRPRTTATGPTRCCSRTSSRARTTSPISMPCAAASTRIVLGAGVESEARWPTAVPRPPPSVSARARGLPERPRWLPRRRIRPAGRPGWVRRQAARGPRPGLRYRRRRGLGTETRGRVIRHSPPRRGRCCRTGATGPRRAAPSRRTRTRTAR